MIHYTLSNTRLLPIEYLEVAYIESTGTLYIDTGIKPTFNTTTYIKFLTTADLPLDTNLFGATNGDFKYALYIGDGGTNFKCYNNFSSGTSYFAIITENRELNEFLFNDFSHNVIWNNVLKTTITNPNNLSSSVNMWIFRINGSGVTTAKFKCYSFIIWESGVLKRHFVSCYRKSDNKPGLFDIVEKKFYINSGSGEFILGNEIRPIPEEYLLVEWIGNEKAQGYINIAYTHVANTWVDTELSFDSLYNYNTMFGACTTDNGSDSFTFGARNNGIINADLGSGYQTSTVLFTAGTFSKLKISPATIIKDSTTISPNKSTTACDKPWALFTRRNGTSYTNESGHGRIKYMKIYEGTFNNTSATLKRDLVPCYRKKDNVSGVYDLVTKTFYASTIPLKTGYPINQIYEMDVTDEGGDDITEGRYLTIGLGLLYVSCSSSVSGNERSVTINSLSSGSTHGFYMSLASIPQNSGKYTFKVTLKASRAITVSIGHERGGTFNANLTTSYLTFTKTWTTGTQNNQVCIFYASSYLVGDVITIKDLSITRSSTPYLGYSNTLIITNVGQSYGIEGQYDKNIYTESDGSKWIRIFHHNNPANARFESTDTFTTGVYKDANRWFDVAKCNEVNKWELMVKQKTTSDAVTSTYRFILYVNPMSATSWDLVKPGTVKNISGGTLGGIWRTNTSAYLVTANSASTNWFGAIGAWNSHQGGIPGYPNTVITSGFMDLYLRVDNVCPIYKDCYLFNGNNSKMITSYAWNPSTYTISVWVKKGFNGTILRNNTKYSPVIDVVNSNIRFFQWISSSSTVSAFEASESSNLINGWNLLNLTYDGTNLKAYINGLLKGSVSSSSPYCTGNLLIGTNPDGAGLPFKGYMLDLRIYDYALTDNEILKLYNMRNV